MNGSFSLITASQLVAVVLLVLANGFFVAAEFALVAVRRSRVEQLVAEGHPGVTGLQRAVNHLDSYLAATQLGVTMSSLGLGWMGEPAIAHLLEPSLEQVLPDRIVVGAAHTLASVIAFTIITALHIVLGELAPKSLALQRPEGTSLWVIKPLELYLAIFRPAVKVLNDLGNLVLSLLGLEAGSGEAIVHSPEEIQLLVAASRQAGLVGLLEEEVMERVLRLGDQYISAFMTPRVDIVWLDIEAPIATLQNTIVTSIYSHFPVCQGSVDNLLGFVRAKDFLIASAAKPLTITPLMNLLTPPLYIPEIMKAFNALEMFKQTGNRTAVVVDEYGVLQGLVTLNDVLEAIVGDIHTGDEPAEPQAIRGNDGSWIFDGSLPIEEFQDIFGIRELPLGERYRYQTIGGLVIMHLNQIPIASQSFEWHNLRFEVMEMHRNRVKKVLVQPLL
jgi:putative hemolysin